MHLALKSEQKKITAREKLITEGLEQHNLGSNSLGNSHSLGSRGALEELKDQLGE